MNYLSDMKLFGGKVQMRRSAIVLAAALAVNACGGSSAESVDEPATEENATNQIEAVSLGDREAGYGQGSLAVLAGEYLDRLAAVEGDWFPGPTLTLDIPEVCGLSEPAAVQGVILVRPVDETGIQGDVISTEIRVYDTVEEAEALVRILNGGSADDCDRASLEVALETAVPGVTYDFGDGVGEPAPVPDGLPDGLPADSRSYDFEIIFGSVREALVQNATVVVDGRVVVSFSASTTQEDVGELEAELIAALFDDPAPEVIESPNLDVLIEDVRRSVLIDSQFPEFYDPTHPMTIGGPGDPDVCFTAAPPVATTSGPFWLAFSPGIGASEVGQGNRIYSNVAAATAAFDELVNLGVDCFPEEFESPEGFELAASAGEVLEIDGRSVVHIELEYLQTVGNQTFDVEVKIAIAQFDEVLTSVRFFGLAGDSPDLPELVAFAAERGAGS